MLPALLAAQSAERAILLEAEQKAARDARYAARKAAKKEGTRGLFGQFGLTRPLGGFALDAKGNEIPGVESPPGGNQHDAMTGSDSQGRAFTDGTDHTCNNWTSDGMTLAQQNPNVPADRARAMLGHTDRSVARAPPGIQRI